MGGGRRVINEEGVVYHGLIGQRKLRGILNEMNFSLNLQSRKEPFGMVITKSMQAGCIVIASPVGAFPELITDAFNGFLIPGEHNLESTRVVAANKILELIQSSDNMEYIRDNAMNFPLSWGTISQSWEGHWDWYLSGSKITKIINTKYPDKCELCSGIILSLPDGQHCIDCGYYSRHLTMNLAAK